ncbi:primosomal protein N' [Nocardia anaemiae]|uniref:primosomal protein N' n=1 Tax=Nocardia anaemiae TaxID=263910 RepID=UPI000B26F265|nr:primosomal protein N' [Nocardia anaemiae]
MAPADAGAAATHDSTAAGHPIARVLPLLSPAHLDRDFDYLVPPELDEIAQPGVRVRVRFAGRLVDGYLLARLSHSDHTGKMVELERVVSAERVLTPEILRLATAVAARYAGTRADVLRLAIPPRHARTENGGSKKSAEPAEPQQDSGDSTDGGTANSRTTQASTPSRGPTRASGNLRGSLDSELGDDSTVEPAAAASSSRGSSPDPDSAASDAEAVQPAETRNAAAAVAADSGAVPSTEQAGAGSADAAVGAGDAAPEGVRVVDAARSANIAAALAGSSSDGMPDGVDLRSWEQYVHGAAFVSALGQGKGVRAGWQAVPGEDWARRLAELAAVVVGRGRSAILMVPDQRDLDRVLAECVRLVGDSAIGLAAGLGPAARYRRWLAALRGTARVIVGTRSAVFAPVVDLGLIAIWDDGDDTYAEPRAPYPHAREVAMLRAHETGAAFVAAGFARTAEIQAVVDSGWAHDLVADRAVVRRFSPRISAPGDSDIAMERDPVARAVRIPAIGYAAARSALKEGAAVLVQVPRRGYIPALACAKCRTPARCRHCNGPLALPDGRAGHRGETAHSPACRWCGITEAAFRCPACASRALRAVVIGAARTAEELGRAFPGVPIRGSSGGAMLDTVEPGPQVIVATVGAEPVLPGGYGVALLLDGWALLSRADLRAAEDTLRRWMSAATLVRNHGQVIVMAEPSLPTVQALLRWDPIGHARAEVASRAEVGFPPAVRMAAIDGTSDSIGELLSAAKLPENVDLLGPVPLPPGARKPFDSGDTPAEVERVLLRVHRSSGAALARALTAAQAVRSTHRSDAPLRVQIDPVDIG